MYSKSFCNPDGGVCTVYPQGRSVKGLKNLEDMKKLIIDEVEKYKDWKVKWQKYINLDLKIKSKIDFVIYEGEIKGKPSALVDLTKEKEEIKER